MLPSPSPAPRLSLLLPALLRYKENTSPPLSSPLSTTRAGQLSLKAVCKVRVNGKDTSTEGQAAPWCGRPGLTLSAVRLTPPSFPRSRPSSNHATLLGVLCMVPRSQASILAVSPAWNAPPYLSVPRHLLLILCPSTQAAFPRKASGNITLGKEPSSHVSYLITNPQVSVTLKGQIFLLGVCAPRVGQVLVQVNA